MEEVDLQRRANDEITKPCII